MCISIRTQVLRRKFTIPDWYEHAFIERFHSIEVVLFKQTVCRADALCSCSGKALSKGSSTKRVHVNFSNHMINWQISNAELSEQNTVRVHKPRADTDR